MDMGQIIKSLRLQNNLTQEELGKIIGVQKSAIRKYESGAVENMKRSSIKKMADYFKVSPSYLMGLEDVNFNINNGIIGNENKNNTIHIGVEANGEIETELVSICKKLNIQQKNKLLTYAYDLMEEK